MFDAGSGAPALGKAIIDRGVDELQLFFSHSHYDHVLGLPFFEPLFDPRVAVTVWAGHLFGSMGAREMVHAFLNAPWTERNGHVDDLGVTFKDFEPGTLLHVGGIRIKTAAINHPGGCVGYRIQFGGRAAAFVYDIEHMPGALDPVALDLMHGADLVVYDSAYDDSEMETFRNFGHSSWQQGIRLATVAGAKRLALFHHMPERTDLQLLEIEQKAKALLPTAFLARQGLAVRL
ncbi:MBL fold metallo-hydrolase [Sinorhizobium meliloti]|nr:MBL fold metallo-hydrolase [Sinorhizobium meliloti]WQP36210.1 MBL fold metallo-hydrolase [Sinorhizobium meliloti]